MRPIFVEFRSAASERRQKRTKKKERRRNPGRIKVRRHTMSGGLFNGILVLPTLTRIS